MTEEFITKSIMMYLQDNGWSLISFDYPQSGSGYRFNRNLVNVCKSTQNSIIPDVMALINDVLFIWENKNKFTLNDLLKYDNFATAYSDSLESLKLSISFKGICFGIGLANTSYNVRKTLEYREKLDFAVLVDDTGNVTVHIQDPYCLLK
jgi:hypothetical protein